VTARTIAVARPARREDAAAIARIYNEGIEDRIATFETDRRTTADIERLLDDRLGRYPAIVVERDGQVVAWASAGTYRARPCYDPIAEHSVYVDHGHCGIAVGRIALEALCAEAEQLGFLKLVSRIFPRTSPAWRCTTGSVSARSASTAATASSMATGVTA
jgi:L-amino acid N-acyltransferase YncA